MVETIMKAHNKIQRLKMDMKALGAPNSTETKEAIGIP